jgi:hypothetical protein
MIDRKSRNPRHAASKRPDFNDGEVAWSDYLKIDKNNDEAMRALGVFLLEMKRVIAASDK